MATQTLYAPVLTCLNACLPVRVRYKKRTESWFQGTLLRCFVTPGGHFGCQISINNELYGDDGIVTFNQAKVAVKWLKIEAEEKGRGEDSANPLKSYSPNAFREIHALMNATDAKNGAEEEWQPLDNFLTKDMRHPKGGAIAPSVEIWLKYAGKPGGYPLPQYDADAAPWFKRDDPPPLPHLRGSTGKRGKRRKREEGDDDDDSSSSSTSSRPKKRRRKTSPNMRERILKTITLIENDNDHKGDGKAFQPIMAVATDHKAEKRMLSRIGAMVKAILWDEYNDKAPTTKNLTKLKNYLMLVRETDQAYYTAVKCIVKHFKLFKENESNQGLLLDTIKLLDIVRPRQRRKRKKKNAPITKEEKEKVMEDAKARVEKAKKKLQAVAKFSAMEPRLQKIVLETIDHSSNPQEILKMADLMNFYASASASSSPKKDDDRHEKKVVVDLSGEDEDNDNDDAKSKSSTLPTSSSSTTLPLPRLNRGSPRPFMYAAEFQQTSPVSESILHSPTWMGITQPAEGPSSPPRSPGLLPSALEASPTASLMATTTAGATTATPTTTPAPTTTTTTATTTAPTAAPAPTAPKMAPTSAPTTTAEQKNDAPIYVSAGATPQCQAFTQNAQQCSRESISGSKYCKQHKRAAARRRNKKR